MQSIFRRGRVDVEIADGTLTVLEAGEQGCNINPVIVVDRMPDSHIVDEDPDCGAIDWDDIRLRSNNPAAS
jgi:hypothetical protein